MQLGRMVGCDVVWKLLEGKLLRENRKNVGWCAYIHLREARVYLQGGVETAR